MKKLYIFFIALLGLPYFSFAQGRPGIPGVFINPVASTCKKTNGLIFTVAAPVSGGAPTSYVWTISPILDHQSNPVARINGSTTFPLEVAGSTQGRTVTIDILDALVYTSVTISVKAKNSAGESNARTYTLALNEVPTVPVINSNVINAGSFATLTSVGCNGKVNWYANQETSSLLQADTDTFNTSVMYESRLYYAKCVSDFGCVGPVGRKMVSVVEGTYEWAADVITKNSDIPGRTTGGAIAIVKTDASGNFYIAGNMVNAYNYTHNNTTNVINGFHLGESELFIMKLDPNRNFLWGKSLGMKDSNDGFADLEISNDGFVYLLTSHGATGDAEGNSTTPTDFRYDNINYQNIWFRGGTLTKVNASTGNAIWVKSVNQLDNGFTRWAGPVEVNATRVFSVEAMTPTSQSWNIPMLFAAELSTLNASSNNQIETANKIWKLGGGIMTDLEFRYFGDYKLINNGNSMIVTGYAGIDWDVFVMCRLDNINTNTPTVAWKKDVGKGVHGFTVDNSGNVYTIESIGFSPNSPSSIYTFAGENFDLGWGYSHGFIKKFNANGTEAWALKWDAPNYISGGAYDKILSDGTNIYAMSSMSESFVSIGGKVTGGPEVNKWLVKVKPDRTVDWVHNLNLMGQQLDISFYVNPQNLFFYASNINTTLGIFNLAPGFSFDNNPEGATLIKYRPIDRSCLPTSPSSIQTQTVNLCKGQKNVSFSVNNSQSTLKWFYRGKGGPLNSDTGNQISLNINVDATSDTLYCVPSNTCGAGNYQKIFLNINQNSPTTRISPATDVNFIANNTTSFKVDFTGTPPYNFTMSDGSVYTSTTNSKILEKNGITQSQLFTISSVSDAACPAGLNYGEVFITLPRCLDKALKLSDGSFRNVDGYFFNGDRITASGLPDMNNEWTVAMWIHPYNTLGSGIFGGGGLYIGLANEHLVVGTTELTNVLIEKNKWTHIAVSPYPTEGKIFVYKNGIQVASIATNANYDMNNSGFTIGNDGGAGPYYRGLVDDVIVLNYSWLIDDVRKFILGNLGDYSYDLKYRLGFNNNGTGSGITVSNLASNGTAGNATTAGPTTAFPDICTVPPAPNPITTNVTNFCKSTVAGFSTDFTQNTTYAWSYSGSDVSLFREYNTIKLIFGPNATSGVLSVRAYSPSGFSAPVNYTINVGNCNTIPCFKNSIKMQGTDNIVVSNTQDINTGATSIAFWMKPNSFEGKGIMVANYNFGQNFIGFSSAGNLSFGSTSSWGGWSVSEVVTQIPFSNTWQHIALCSNLANNSTIVYLNGVYLQTIQNAVLFTSFGGFTIGNDYRANSGFDGELDEISVWDKQLSAVEVSQIYEAKTLTGHENSLVMYYNFNGITGQGPNIAIANQAVFNSQNFSGTTNSSTPTNPIVSPYSGESITNSVSGVINSNRKIVSNSILYAPPSNQTNIISTGTNVEYYANNSVMLQPGFKTDEGAVFKAQIAGCN